MLYLLVSPICFTSTHIYFGKNILEEKGSGKESGWGEREGGGLGDFPEVGVSKLRTFWLALSRQRG